MDFQREQGGTLQATLDLVINAQNIEPENLNDSDSIQAVGVANVDLLMNIRDAAKRIRGHDISNSSTLKDSIVSDIADESGIGYLTSNSLIGSWASSSNDTNPVSLGAQIAVADTLGSPLSDWQKRQIDGLASHRDEMDTTAKSVAPPAIKAIYNITQQAFRAVGLSPDDTVVLYRGMDGVVGIDPGEVVAYHGNASESWSFDKDTADGFGHRTFATRVRVKDIYSTCYTGVGCLGEAEVVTINNSNRESVMIDRSRFR